MPTRLTQLNAIKLADEDAERVRRNHHEAIAELQRQVRSLVEPQTAYLLARMSADQTTSLTVGAWIEFDKVVTRGKGIIASTGTGQALGRFTLQAGTYEVHYGLRGNVNEGSFQYAWYDNARSVRIVDVTGEDAPAIYSTDNLGTDDTEMPSAAFIVATETPLTFRLQAISLLNPVNIDSDNSYALIKAI